MICTFFGHRDAPESIEPVLHDTLLRLIQQENADDFYVGSQGGFDSMVMRVLKKLRVEYPHIRCTVILAYMPLRLGMREGLETIFPDGLERVPQRFAVDRRNRWMIDRADCVVTYVERTVGGAAKYKHLAEQKQKMIIELAK
ncbi:MAG: hypothetical protein IKU17_05320 [Clostridia bacterium]|nr:hypothetical protein [Clostridia bacterium]